MNETALKSTTDEKFINITEFVFGKNFINEYNYERIYSMYKIVEENLHENEVFMYNQFLRLLVIDKYDIKYLNNKKDKNFLSKIFSYLSIIKKNLDDIELHINFYKYETLSLEEYNELINLKNKLRNESPSDFYRELWFKFLDNSQSSIIERKIEYYIDTSKDVSVIKNINNEIVKEYINTFNMNKINYEYLNDEIMNNTSMIFFLILNDNI